LTSISKPFDRYFEITARRLILQDGKSLILDRRHIREEQRSVRPDRARHFRRRGMGGDLCLIDDCVECGLERLPWIAASAAGVDANVSRRSR
jgi:hypothetical protein